MMPELGKYGGTVLSAYGISLLLLLGLVGFSAQDALNQSLGDGKYLAAILQANQ